VSRGTLILLVAVVVASHARIAAAAPPLVEPGAIGAAVEVLVDPGGTLEVDEVARLDDFRPSGRAHPSFGYSDDAYWFRFTVPPGDEPWLLEVAYPLLDEVDLYLRTPGGTWRHHATGDLRPFASRAVAHPDFVFPVPRSPEGPTEVYLRVRSTGMVAVPLHLWRAEAFARHDQRAQLAWGAYFAFLGALALYNLFLFAAIRDRAYLYYVAYLASWVLFQASLSGHAAMYLWPNWPAWSNAAAISFVACSIAAALAFIRGMTHLRATVPRLDLPLRVLVALLLAAVPLTWLSYPVGIRATVVIAAIAVLFLPVPIVLAYRRGHRPARYVLLGVVAIFPGALLQVLRQFELVPSHPVTEHAIHASTMLEALLLSFALADRIDLRRQAEADAQRAFAHRLIAAQDAERKRIAGDLHDGVGQDLLVLVNRLKRERSDAADLAGDLVVNLRAIAHDLHPHQLERLGLTAAVRETARRTLDAAGIEGACEVDDVDGVLPREAELHLYRILQEALANLVRHAEATRAAIELRRSAGGLRMVVADDGKGVPSAPAPGLGLAGIEERVRLLGGRLSIDGASGTRIAVEVPT
jgi:signal transduction histidine kinase